jgi:hypothetical protein
VYFVDVNLFYENVNAIKENTVAVLFTGEEFRLEVYARKTKLVFISDYQSA